MSEPNNPSSWPGTYVFITPDSEEPDPDICTATVYCERHAAPVPTFHGTMTECIAWAQDHWGCQPL